MRIVYSSDIHGQTSHYDELLEMASKESARAIILGGDLLPPPRGLSSPAGREDARRRQAEYLAMELTPRLEQARKSGRDVLLLLGNYDLGAIASEFEDTCSSRGMLTLHEKAHSVQGEIVAGLSWVNHTPFPLKDWETWDLRTGELPAGALDHRDPRAVFTWERTDGFTPFAVSLEALAGRTPGAERDQIYVLHAPPHGVGLDVVSRRDEPVGSHAVRQFIDVHQPRLTLHGHIHESPHVSGVWAVQLGNTLAIQPGQSAERLHAVMLDTADPASTARHTIFGAFDPKRTSEAAAFSV